MLTSTAAAAAGSSLGCRVGRRCLSGGFGRFSLPPLTWRRRQDARAALSQLEVGPPDFTESVRERHLPLTKASLVRLLSKETAGIQQLAESLDNAIANRFYGGLRDLQQLYRPLNPDDDTSDNAMARRERLDSEFSFLQRLASLLRLANFRELSANELTLCLRPHASAAGVTVSVDAGQYDVLRAWVIGRTNGVDAGGAAGGFLSRIRTALSTQRRGGDGEGGGVYQRLVLAVRLRRSDRLAIKMFRNVDTAAVDMLLPEGNLLMSRLDRGVIATTLSVGSIGVMFSFYAWEQHLPYIDWSCLVTCLSLAAAFRGIVTYKERKSRHLMRLNGLIYHNCLASNRPLLAMLTERAEDEALKEALLCYCCVLQNGPLPAVQLEQAVQDWAAAKCDSDVDFDCSGAVELLLSLGLVSYGDGEGDSAQLVALSPQQALGQLPATPAGAHWLLTDQSDAFEKDRYALLVDRERRMRGWQ